MIKHAAAALVIIAMTVSFIALPSRAKAMSGEIVLEDMAYGAIIGGMLGGAWYLLDQDNGEEKLGAGVGVGIIGGFILGLTDASAVVKYENGTMYASAPMILTVPERGGNVRLQTQLFQYRF
jgi:hypothetical protein